jgi:chromate transporter
VSDFRARRTSFADWLLLNFKIGCLSFGGATRITMYQDELVDARSWMSEPEFVEVYTVSQVFPGPNLVNLVVYLGYLFFGLGGAVLGMLALGLPGALAVVALSNVLDLKNPDVRLLFQGFSIGCVGLFVVFVGRMLRTLLRQYQHSGGGRFSSRARLRLRLLLIVIVAGLGLTSWPLPWVLLVGGAVAWGVETWM